MKKMLTLLTMVAISASIMAQSQRTVPASDPIPNLSEIRSSFLLNYDSNPHDLFKVAVVKQKRLDRIEAPGDHKIIYTYANNNQSVTSVRYSWISSSWLEQSKNEYIYNNNGVQTLNALYSWDSSGNKWVGSYKSTHEYNGNGDVILMTSYSWDDVQNSWSQSTKMEYGYDANSNHVSSIIYTWNTDESLWQETSKNEYGYDDNGNEISYITYLWTGSDWMAVSRKLTQYNADNLPTVETSSNWMMAWMDYAKTEYSYTDKLLTVEIDYTNSGATWTESEKIEYSYNGNNLPILEISYAWSGAQWEYSSKTELGYNNSGYNTLYKNYEWDAGWVGSLGSESTYDGNNNISMTHGLGWNNDWYVNRQEEWTFNTNYTMNELIMPSVYIMSANMPVSNKVSLYNASSQTLFEAYTETYYFSDVTTNIFAPLEKNSISISPNPATDHFFVTGILVDVEVKVFNLSGKQLLNVHISPGEVIPVGHLTTGVYIIKVVAISEIATFKLVKE